MLIYNDIKKQITYSKHQEVVSNWDYFFFPFQVLRCELLSGSDIALICVRASSVATQILPCHAAPLSSVNDSRTTISSLPFLVSTSDFYHQTVQQFLFGWGLGFFVFTVFNLSVEISHLIVTHLIEKRYVKTGNTRFGEGFACTSMEWGPILKTACSYLRPKATLNLTAVHDNVCKIRPCTAQVLLSREISFVFMAFAKKAVVSIFTFGRKKTKPKPEFQCFQQISKETPMQTIKFMAMAVKLSCCLIVFMLQLEL